MAAIIYTQKAHLLQCKLRNKYFIKRAQTGIKLKLINTPKLINIIWDITSYNLLTIRDETSMTAKNEQDLYKIMRKWSKGWSIASFENQWGDKYAIQSGKVHQKSWVP